jgi:hypothetical protein
MTIDFSGGIQSRTSRRAAIQVRSVVVGASTRNAEAILMPFPKGYSGISLPSRRVANGIQEAS